MKKSPSIFAVALIAFTPLVFCFPNKEEAKKLSEVTVLNQHASTSLSPIIATAPTLTSTFKTTLASPNESLSTLSKPHVFSLPDGLTIIVEEDHTAPIAAVQAWCATGSIHEGAHLGAGVSHILEHMLFKGTIHRPPGVIAEQVRCQGGYMNAYTTYDRTVYHIDVPSAGVVDAIDILADMMVNATLSIEEYNKEQEVIRREFTMRADSPDVLAWELLCRTAYHVSPLREPVIGCLDTYNKLTREEVMAYYHERYVPSNICFIIVGDVNAEKIKKQLTLVFEKYPYRPLQPVITKKEPPQLIKRVVSETFPMKQSFLNIAWKAPSYAHADTPALEVLTAVLGLGKDSLLNQGVREKKELVYYVGAGLDSVADLIWIGATSDPQKRDAGEAEILQQVDSLKIHGATKTEVERAKKMVIAAHFYGLENVDAQALEYGNSWIATGDPCYQEDFFKAISCITPEDVNRVAKQYLVKEKLTIASLNPKSISESSSKKNETPKEGRATSAIKKFILPNGLRLLIHEDHKLPLVSIAALFRGGVMAEDAKRSGLTQLLSSAITKGTHAKNAEQIVQTLEQVGGTMNASAGDDSFGICVNVMKSDFQLGLDLLADVLIKPIFPAAEVDREKKNQLAACKMEDDQIVTAAYKLLQKKLFSTHPYAHRSVGTSESVAALTPEMLQEYWKQYVVGNNGVIAIFGDVKTEEVLAMATKAFSEFPSGRLALQSVPIPEPLVVPLHDQATKEREQSIVMKGFLGASITSSDRPVLELLSAACNGWGSRFFKGMRDTRGLVYFVSSRNTMRLAPGSFIFFLGADPKKSALASEELHREIDQLVQAGLTQEELDQAKKTVLQDDALTHQSNANFGNIIASDELMGLGFEHEQHHADEVNAVTLEQVNRVIKKYLGASGSVEVVVGPAAAR